MHSGGGFKFITHIYYCRTLAKFSAYRGTYIKPGRWLGRVLYHVIRPCIGCLVLI